MKPAKLMLLVLVSVFLSAVVSGQATNKTRKTDLMPVPAKIRFADGRLNLGKDFPVAVKGKPDARLAGYLFRAMRRLESRTVKSFPRTITKNVEAAKLVINVKRPGNRIPKLGDDESYKLEIGKENAVLTANETVGAMRGIETLLQLLEGDEKGFYFPAVSIDDKPRFQWRGLLIDVARHYQPMDVLKRNIDGLAAVKMNVLHWHLTEDQGFRVESKKFPRLHTMGSDGLFYTHEEIREIIAYAADRGIRVMPEFDMPGHATSWLVGHPELGSLPGPYQIERKPGIFDPTLNPIKENTYRFLDTFLTEMAGLFPDAYMHIGGDENEGKQWDANPEIQAFMKKNGIKDNHELQTYFNKRILKFLQKNNKIMMGWDEIFQPDLPKDIVIHSWRGQKALGEAARKGYMGVLSNGYYIDLIYPAKDHYLVDPIPADTKLSKEEQKRILGGEATMWGEWVSPETIDSRIWMRTAAIAERFWSPQNVRDVDDMYRRLDILSPQLEELGLTHRRNQDVLLRRLAMGKDSWALKWLVAVVEPVKQYRRYQQRPQTMLDPLTGLIDAAQPDAPGARKLDRMVTDFLTNPTDKKSREALESIFIDWTEAGEKLTKLMSESPGLREAKELGPELSNLGRIGLRALSYMREGTNDDRAWKAGALFSLEEISKPKAAVEFVVIDSIKRLVEAAVPEKSTAAN